jgi:hypothetical protein
MRIKSLRLLPPLAFARFGSAREEPQPNFELKINKDDPLGFREIDPAQTLKLGDDGSVSIPSTDERKLRLLAADNPKVKLAELNKLFRVGNLIRPVAPFFELFAIVENDPDKLVPVTPELLKSCGVDSSAVEWNVRVENRKVFRRTGDKYDIVTAGTGWFSNHDRRWLRGKCRHFIKGKTIDFGYVQFVRPTPTDGVRSHLRLRFTPAPGKIYGPARPRREVPDDTDYVERIYKGAWPQFDNEKPDERKRRSRGSWPHETLPPSLYANTNRPPAAPWLNQDRAVSRGYLDDACDGFIYVRIRGRDELQAKARICVAPPAFIPDSQFVRTLADDLDQVVNGPKADDLKITEARERALDTVRRAYETVRFMNVSVMNGNPVDGRPAEAFDTMPAEEAFATQRPVRPVMAPASADTTSVLALHQHVFAALSSGTVPWFLQLLRKPEEVGDLTDKGRRKMPALMSGADAYYLALTRRQIKTIEKAAKARRSAPPASTSLPASSPPPLLARNLTAQLQYRAKGNPPTSQPGMAISNCCPGLEVDFRAVWRRLFAEIELSEWENYVVKGAATLKGKKINLKGRRLLRVDGIPVTVNLTGPSPADLVASHKETSLVNSDRDTDADRKPIVRSDRNPHGVWTMEWSNCLAHVLNALRVNGKRKVKCEFTATRARDPQPQEAKAVKVTLTVQDFFEPGTAVISRKLAEPGELTQGLCSPWQNDLRECSCFYWASSRPDFINTEIGNDGLTHGDYWFARKRTGEYVPDDYADTRLMGYDDLFKEWEKLLQFQIGGKDSARELLDLPDDGGKPGRRKP